MYIDIYNDICIDMFYVFNCFYLFVFIYSFILYFSFIICIYCLFIFFFSIKYPKQKYQTINFKKSKILKLIIISDQKISVDQYQ